MGSSGGLWWPRVFWASLENQTVPRQGIPASKPMAIWDILWVWVDLKVSDPCCMQLANWDLDWKLGPQILAGRWPPGRVLEDEAMK